MSLFFVKLGIFDLNGFLENIQEPSIESINQPYVAWKHIFIRL